MTEKGKAELNDEEVLVRCLRCVEVELEREDHSGLEIEFFGCPRCRRQYARRRGGRLVYRWLHPVTLALHAVLFEKDLVAAAPSVAKAAASGFDKERLAHFVDEIELELRQPTQNVRECLDSPSTEAECRAFLEAVVAWLRGGGGGR